jgi:hypothetical protein
MKASAGSGTLLTMASTSGTGMPNCLLNLSLKFFISDSAWLFTLRKKLFRSAWASNGAPDKASMRDNITKVRFISVPPHMKKTIRPTRAGHSIYPPDADAPSPNGAHTSHPAAAPLFPAAVM